jgi:hypothetical protein
VTPEEARRRRRERSPIPEPDESMLPPRYRPERALPAYRFVPGLYPHPVIDPAGHSHGKPERRQRPLSADDWPRNEEYLHGVDLFNRRYYWEAHEAWESAWRACDRDGTQGQFLQGLILVAAALLQWFMGSPAGVGRQGAKASRRLGRALEESPGEYMGIRLEPWLAEVEACLSRLASSQPPRMPEGIRLPVIVLSRYNPRASTPAGG